MFGRDKRIYLDYASATPVHPKAARALARAIDFANPGAIHADGVEAKRALTKSRERIAAHLGCKPREVIFTSGLTEANTLAIVGSARAHMAANRATHASIQGESLEGTHWVVSSIEHSSVLECFSEIERMGGSVTHINPAPNGLFTPDMFARALRPSSVFVSVGWANNELGTIQPLSAIARVIRGHERKHKTKVVFHSDAGQAPVYRAPHVHTLGVDILALGSGKLYGPRGIGALYLSQRAALSPVSFGGRQERGLRPGTEDVTLAGGFAEAFDAIALEREKESKRLKVLRDELAREIRKRIPGTFVNGDLKHALPHMLNVSIPGERTGEYLTLVLDHAGISLSTKSACREGEAVSHVVEVLGGEPWRARNTLRISLGTGTKPEHAKRLLEILPHLAHSSA